MKSHFQSKTSLYLVLSILLVIVLRIAMMHTMPLMDTTEARYGELARVTATGNYWLMPHMSPTEPFFAKPPLSTWFAASGWMGLGHDELALRLPSLLLVLLSCLALLYGAKNLNLTRTQWLLACLVIFTAPIGYISAGAVMTDATQMAVVTWAMVLLWRLQTNNTDSLKRDQYALWITLGIGAVAKGLATWALIGLPVLLFWVCSPKEVIKQHFRNIWFLPGIAVFIALVLAWYVPAEMHYPGFLKYFIVGEHFQRFLQPGWKGDMYGNAHREAIGMIWLFWILSIAIWLPVFIRNLYQDRPLLNTALSLEKKWLWAWTLAPLIFFTFSRNIIWTYTLTALPAFALLVATSWSHLSDKFRNIMQVTIVVWLVLGTAASLVWIPTSAETRSDRKLVYEAQSRYPDMTFYSYGSHKFSVSYYTNGHIRELKDRDALQTMLQQPNALLITSSRLGRQIEASGLANIVDTNADRALLITKH